MTKRITDERLAEIKLQLPFWRTQKRYAFAQELMPALEAERDYAKQLEAWVAELELDKQAALAERNEYGRYNAQAQDRAEQAEATLASVVVQLNHLDGISAALDEKGVLYIGRLDSAAESALKRVRELPEEWRKYDQPLIYPQYAECLIDCADELETALKAEPRQEEWNV